MPDEPLPVRSKIGFERGYDRREHAADAFARGKRIDCSIIRHFLIVPSSLNFSGVSGPSVRRFITRVNMQIFPNRSAGLVEQIWVLKRPNEPAFRRGIRFSIAVFHW